MTEKELPTAIFNSSASDIEVGEKLVVDALGHDFMFVDGLPKNVGNKGDERVYGDSVIITTDSPEAFESMYRSSVGPDVVPDPDPKTADALGELSAKITNTLPSVTRVLLDITVARSDKCFPGGQPIDATDC